VFVTNGNRCPKCGRRVKVGAEFADWSDKKIFVVAGVVTLSGAALILVCGLVSVLTR
jgi:hypothetical protein